MVHKYRGLVMNIASIASDGPGNSNALSHRSKCPSIHRFIYLNFFLVTRTCREGSDIIDSDGSSAENGANDSGESEEDLGSSQTRIRGFDNY